MLIDEIMDYLSKLYKAGLITKWDRKSAADFNLEQYDSLPLRSDTLFTVHFPDIENKKYIMFWASDIENKRDINKIFILTGMEYDRYQNEKRRQK